MGKKATKDSRNRECIDRIFMKFKPTVHAGSQKALLPEDPLDHLYSFKFQEW
jgi:hypothetical protein